MIINCLQLKKSIKCSCCFSFVALVFLILTTTHPIKAHEPVRGASSAAVRSAARLQGIPAQAKPQHPAARPDLSSRKVLFMENAGQITDLHGRAVPDVRYLLRSPGLNIQLRSNGFSYDAWMPVFGKKAGHDGECNENAGPQEQSDITSYKYHRVDVGLKNSNPNPEIIATGKDDVDIQIFHDQQHLSVRSYGTILYKNIYDGIDLEFVAGGKNGTVAEYNFIVHPGADPSRIQLEYAGADDFRLEGGIIRMDIAHGTIEENIPASWQEETKKAVEVAYALHDKNTVGFQVGAYDPATTLVIDPTPRLVWGTYFQSDYSQPYIDANNYLTVENWTHKLGPFYSYLNVNSEVVDKEGNLYIAVTTALPDWKVSFGAYQGEIAKIQDPGGIQYYADNPGFPFEQFGWGFDIYIMKFNTAGRLTAATYYGGGQDEYFPSLAISDDGLYMACVTRNRNLDAVNTYTGDDYEDIVVKFSTNLKNQLWARYFGGDVSTQNIHSIATDPSGNVMLAAESRATNYPNAGGLDNGAYNGTKIFGTKLNGANGDILWSGVLAKTDVPSDLYIFRVEGLQSDKSGNFFLLVHVNQDGIDGPSNNVSGIATAGAYNTIYPGSLPDSRESDKFLMKIGPSGNILWASWIGGPGDEFTEGLSDLAVNSKGQPWVSFRIKKQSPLLPTTANAWLPTLPDPFNNGGRDPIDFEFRYLQQYSADGDSLLYSTILSADAYTEETFDQFVSSGSFSLGIDTLTDHIYTSSLVWDFSQNTRQPNKASYYVTDCAHMGLINRTDPPGLVYNWYISKFTPTATERLWSTFMGASQEFLYGRLAIEPHNGRVYVAGEVNTFLDLQDVTSAGTEQPDWKNASPTNTSNYGWLIALLDDGDVPSNLAVTASAVTPQTLSACVGGVIGSFTGNKVTVAVPEGYVGAVLYQWQEATSATGPWTDIAGETGKNLTPAPRDSAGTVFFRRLAQLAGPGCAKLTYDSSNVVSLTSGPKVSPTANAGGTKFYICEYNEITLEGSGSGGLPPYTFEWFIGNDTVPASMTSTLTDEPDVSTLYTLKVTDADGCFGLDQVAVEPVRADAGGNKLLCQGVGGVQLGGPPVQGASEVNYSWSPADGLNCTTCGQPVASPQQETSYQLLVTVLQKSGEVCSMTSSANVKPIEAPDGNLDFAGPDLTVCQGDTGTLGLPPVSGINYTWAPGLYLTTNALSQTTYDAGTNVVRNPLRYALTTVKDGCTFTDYADVYTIYKQITPRNVTICNGPAWFRQEADAGEANHYTATYTWEKTGGDAEIEVLATEKNGADAYIRLKPGSGNSVTFRRKTTLNGVSCYSFFNTINTCEGGGGGGGSCYTEVRVLGGSGCPLPGGGYKVYAKYISPADYKYKWSPSWAFDNDSIATPRLITAASGVNISVLATNKFANSITCADTLYVNDPTLSLPSFSSSDVAGCKGDLVQIGAPPVGGYSYIWNSSIGFQGDPAVERFNSRPILKLSSSRNYTITVTDVGTGCFVKDTVKVSVPNVTVSAGPDRQACSGAEVTIGAPPPPNTNFTYLWNPQNVPWRPEGAQGQLDPNPTLLFAGNIQMVLTATDPATGCFARDTVVLTTPTAGVAPEVPTPGAICPGEEVLIGTKPVIGATYSWSPQTGLACPTCSETLASPATTTTYTLTITGCGDNQTTSVTVTVLSAPTFSLTNKQHCPTTPIQIGIGAAGNPASLANVAEYKWSPAQGLSCTDCPNPEATNTRPLEYRLTVTYTNGCQAEASALISPEAGTGADAGKDASICPGEGESIGMSAVAGSVYTWSPTDGLDNPSSASTVATPDETTIYTLTVTRGACTAKDSVRITVRTVPDMVLSGNTTICRGGETTIGMSAAPNYLYEWSPSTGVLSPTSSTTILRPTKTTTYKLTQTSAATGCSDFRKITVTVNEPEFSVQTTSPQPLAVCQGAPVQLPLSVFPTQGSYSYSWSPGNSLVGRFDKNPYASPSLSTTYKVSVTNLANNCILVSEVPVTVIPLSQCPSYDYGDAPSVYEKNTAAYHKRLRNFYIGRDLDAESGSQSVFPGEEAKGDDDGLFDDEDAVLPIQALHPRKSEVRITVSDVRNDTFPVAYLAAWADLNRNACFDDDERRVVPVLKSLVGPQTYELVWNGFNTTGILPFGNTYIRFRYTGDITGGWDESPSPYGFRSSGEVEDYNLYIHPTLPFPDFAVVAKGKAISGSLAVNDEVPPGTTYLTPVALGGNPGTALPVVSANGDFSFQTTLPGVYRFNVPVNDGVATVLIPLTITVLDPNAYAPPVAGTDVGMTFQNNPVTLRTLANDFSGRVGTSLVPGSVQITVQPAHGTVSVDPVTGDITYTPNPGYIGPDSYMYSISDNFSPTPGTAQGSQFIQVISPNSANSVLAANDMACAGAGSLRTGNVLVNDTDPEGDAIQTVPIQMTTAEYTFTLDAAGNFSFLSSPSFNDVVTVPYIVIDNNPAEERDTAVLSIYIKNILGDRVWDDANFNGLLDAGEEGVKNVKVTLHTCVGNVPGAAVPNSMVQSDEDGYYLLPLPGNGSYALKFDISMAGNSGGYSFTVPDASNNSSDSQDSDVDPITGYTACFAVTGSASLPQLDAGVYKDSDGDQYPDVVDNSPTAERLGYIYCEQTGEILTGGKISVSGPAPATIVHDGSEGYYQVLTSVVGEYEITLTPPAGFDTAFQCLPQTTPPSGLKQYILTLIDDYGDGWNDAYMEVKQGNTVIAVIGSDFTDGSTMSDTLLLESNTNYSLYYTNGGGYPEEVGLEIYNENGLLIYTKGVGVGAQGTTLFSWSTGGISFGSSNNDGNPDYLDDSACDKNPYYLKLQLGPGIFFTNNNLVVSCLDFGDNPVEYNTLLEDDGPRHKLYQQPLLYLGEKVDAETEGQPDAMAGIMGGGDDGDTATLDDEDALPSIPVVVPGSDLSLVYKATNASTDTAFVKVFVDFNHDFDFSDPGEMQTAVIPAGSAGVLDTLVLSAPLQIPNGDKIGVRLRMSLNSDMAFTGEEEEGEVEDYALLISGYDFGDLPSTYINAGSPPYHIITSKLMLGNSVDSELSGFAGSTATGDDGDSGQATLGVAAPGGDDENGVMLATPMTPGSVATFMVNAINLTGSAAVLQAWVDFNTDGDFDAGEELTTGDFASGGAVVPVGGLNGAKLDFNVPATAVFSADLANVRFRLSPDGELSPDSQSGTAPFGEIEDYSFLTDGNDYDYGDLPDTYNTSGNNNPPRHIVEDSLKLGASLDSDTDGQPDSKAGLLSGGDDGNVGEMTFGTPGSEGDDEDGIQFFGMLASGTTAVVVVDAMNMTGEPAVLQGWIDFNSNGAFEAGEELTTGDFAPGGQGAAVPNGGLSGKKLTFVVPQGATFPNGLAMARFRLSLDGGLAGDSQTGLAPIGEIEDYAFPLAKIGNLTWIDRDNDGMQVSDEPGLDSVKVTLVWAGPDGNMTTEDDNEMQMVVTGPSGGFDQGEYYFNGVGSGQYKLLYEAPASYVATAPNRGAQWQGGQKDSDAVAMGMNVRILMERAFTIVNPLQQPTSEGGNGDNGVNPSGGTPDNQTDETHDAGFWNPCCSDLLKYCCPTQNK